MDGARTEVERRTGPDDLLLEHGLPRRAELELGPPSLDEPRFVLHAVELEAQGLTRLDEQDLADVLPGLGPDQLVAPRLVDPPRLDGPGVETLQVR